MKQPEGFDVVDVSNRTEPMSKKFRIDLLEPGTDTCLLIAFSDPSEAANSCSAIGNMDTCNEIYPLHSCSQSEQSLTQQMFLQHTYSIPGEYKVHFKLGNQLPGSIKSIDMAASVVEIDCNPPIVNIKNPVDDWTNGTQYWRSRPVQLYAKSCLPCHR